MTAIDQSAIDQSVAARAAELTDLLSSLVAIPSVSGQERAMTEYVADWARRQGWRIDLWQGEEDELSRLAPLPGKFIPLAGRPTLVIRLPGSGGGRSLLFSAHADVAPAASARRWRWGPWSGVVHEGKLHGRGACDAKGPLVAALWAMRAIDDLRPARAGDVLLELVPGEAECVGLGTLTSVARGWRADGVVVLKPTEGRPRCASRGGLRFEITCIGRAAHSAVKGLGRDAIALAPAVLAALGRLESRWNDRAADPLFAACPVMRPITVDSIHGGDWRGMVCEQCSISGQLDLLPGDDLEAWRARFTEETLKELSDQGGESFSVQTPDGHAGHAASPGDPLCRAAGDIQSWSAFNSVCQAGVRAAMFGAATLVWGPGSLAQAHAVDEWVELGAVEAVARDLARTAMRYCGAA